MLLVWQSSRILFPPLQVRRGGQVLSYFCTQSSEVCAAAELAEERRSFAFRRASLSYFTLILSDSHAVGFIVRRAFLELLHQAFLKESRAAGMRRQKCSRFIVPREQSHAKAWSLPALPPRGLLLISQKRGLNCLHAPGQRCQGEEWSYSFCCWVENGENTCLGAMLCSALTCSAELLQGATFCCFSPLCFLWQLPKCCIKTASGELRWHSHLPPYWCWSKGSEEKPVLKSDWVCSASRENCWEKGTGTISERSLWNRRQWLAWKKMKKECVSRSFKLKQNPGSLSRAVSWINFSSLSRQTKRLFRSDGELSSMCVQQVDEDDETWTYRSQQRKGDLLSL